MKRSNRGFTVTELAIVIAVIAVLAALLVPSFIGIVAKANLARDEQTVRSVDMLLITDKALGGTHNTMYDAVTLAAQNGIAMPAFSAAVADNIMLWDSQNDLMCYCKNDEYDYISQSATKPSDYKLFAVYSSAPALQQYSVYWDSSSAFTGTLTVGFDAGDNTQNFLLNYERLSGEAQSVIIRTNGQDLTVNAPGDTVRHYGCVKVLRITAVSNDDCYYECGYVENFAYYGTGKVVATATARFAQSMAEIQAICPSIVIMPGAQFDCVLPQNNEESNESSQSSESSQSESNESEQNVSSETSTPHVHSYTEYINYGTYHKKVCSVCGDAEEVVHESETECAVCHSYTDDIYIVFTINGEENSYAYIDYKSFGLFTYDSETINFNDLNWSSFCSSYGDGASKIAIYLPQQFGGGTITKIGAFETCSGLTEIYLPSTVDTIGASAFSDLSSLSKVCLSGALTTIEDNAFYACTSLNTVVLPAGAISVDANAFSHCSPGLNVIILSE